MISRRRLVAIALAVALPCLAFLSVATPYADQITSLAPGPNADFGVPDNMLGPPTGGGLAGGSDDVYALGVGGEVVLRLDTRAWNGPGTDLLVFENPFLVQGTDWDSFAELLTVEVSSDGVSFARFPTDFEGPAGPYLQGGNQLGSDLTRYNGFAGVMPVAAFPPGIDPLDVVAAGGDAFDFEQLLDHPLVLSGDLDLDNVYYVKLVDVQAGVDLDDEGDVIWDSGFPAFASADVDGVCAVNSVFNGLPGRPEVEFSYDRTSGLLTLRLSDLDGLSDIKHGLKASINGLGFPFVNLLPAFLITAIDSQSVTLLTGPVPAGFDRLLLKVSAVDGAGLTRGDAVFLP